MNELQLLLSDISDPVFIVTGNREISFANDAALSGCGEQNPVGNFLDDVVYFAEKTDDACPAFFNQEWLDVSRKSFHWSGDRYSKVALKKRKSVPDKATLEVVRNMIAVLLHRLRSPLTGMQGYSDLIEADLNNRDGHITRLQASGLNGEAIHDSSLLDLNLQRCEKIHEGVQHLFDILDDLELLHKLPGESRNPMISSQAHIEEILQKILLKHPPEMSGRITLCQPEKPAAINCNPAILENILAILIDNAIDNSAGSGSEITVEVTTSHTLKITNSGPVIPEEILKRIFFPFVTSKAHNLGLGLTMAQIFAGQQQASIFLTQNSGENGITFTCCLPPHRMNT